MWTKLQIQVNRESNADVIDIFDEACTLVIPQLLTALAKTVHDWVKLEPWLIQEIQCCTN